MKPPFKKLKLSHHLWDTDQPRPFVMTLADQLSNDPMIASLLGENFKVLVDYNADVKRITYSFRAVEDVGPDESDAKYV